VALVSTSDVLDVFDALAVPAPDFLEAGRRLEAVTNDQNELLQVLHCGAIMLAAKLSQTAQRHPDGYYGLKVFGDADTSAKVAMLTVTQAVVACMNDDAANSIDLLVPALSDPRSAAQIVVAMFQLFAQEFSQ
jgi:hypothetical protein